MIRYVQMQMTYCTILTFAFLLHTTTTIDHVLFGEDNDTDEYLYTSLLSVDSTNLHKFSGFI